MNPLIRYVIPHSPTERDPYSFFQGFSPGLLKTRHLFEGPLTLPASVSELYYSREQSASLRLANITFYDITPLETNAMPYLPISPEEPFICILSAPRYEDEVRKVISKFELPVLHAVVNPKEDEIAFRNLNRRAIWEYVRKVLVYLNQKHQTAASQFLERQTSEYIDWPPIDAIKSPGGHNLFSPNYAALQSIGIPVEIKTNWVGKNLADYVEQTLNSALHVNDVRANIEMLPYTYKTPDVIFAAPALYQYHYIKTLKQGWLQLSGEDRKIAKATLRAIIRQEGYNYQLEVDNPSWLKHPILQSFISERSKELQAFTIGLSIVAASSLAPVLRLPPTFNRLQSQLQKIAYNSRNITQNESKQKTRKKQQDVAELKNDMVKGFPEQFWQFFDKNIQDIKIYTDVPLEWMPVNDVPLMLRHDVSRIPVTPGNIYFANCCKNKPYLLSPEDFAHILIIRSFENGDPLRSILEVAIETISERAISINTTIIDVHNETDLIEALEHFDGAIVIFDCHGSHDVTENVGAILINGTPYNIWQLRGKVRIPPIVLLSACDTHPFDRSHASTANGFLHAGAMTVLATMLPVDGIYGSAFIARLIYRLSEFLPIAAKMLNHPITWSRLVSGLQRMVYLTEIRDILKEHGYGVGDRYEELAQCNLYINMGEYDWYEKSIEEIAKKLKIDTQELSKFIAAKCNCLDILKYIQLGHPEKIWIIGNELNEKISNLYHNTSDS